MKYRPEIDGLRAVAVVPVILFHAGYGLFSGGFVGVDVFFVISGYLIMSIIISETAAGTFTLASFYERRARRILPALFLVIFACIPFAWVWMVPFGMQDFGQSVVATAVFASNILFWQESGYFSASAELKPLLHTWSLAIEEQFYVVFPAFMLLCWRLGPRSVAALVFLAALASFGLSLWLVERDPSANFYLAPTRAWELMIGVLVALYLHHRAPQFPLALANAAGIFGLGLIATSVFLLNEETVFPGFYALAPTVGTAMVIVFAQSGTIVAKALSARALVGIGLISYSAYLWHHPMFAFARLNGYNDSTPWIFSLLALASLPLAYLSWRFVERPFRDRSRLTQRQIFRMAVAGSIAFAIAGTAADVSGGFRLRYSDKANEVADRMRGSPMRGRCHSEAIQPIPPGDSCRYYGDDVIYAVVGDSHAVEIAHAFAEAIRPRGEGIVQMSLSGGAPTLQIPEYPLMQRYWTEALAYLDSQPEIVNVILVYRHSNYLMGDNDIYFPELRDFPSLPRMRGTADEIRERYWQSFLAMVEDLLRHGKRVIIVRPVPELGRNVADIVYAVDASDDVGLGTIPGVSREFIDRRNRYINGKLDTLEGRANLLLFDPVDTLCDAQFCYAVKGATPLYIDSHHVSVAGAQLLARGMLELIDHDRGQ